MRCRRSRKGSIRFCESVLRPGGRRLVALEPGLQLRPDDGQSDGIVSEEVGQEVIGLGADCILERDRDLVGETPSLTFQAADVALGDQSLEEGDHRVVSQRIRVGFEVDEQITDREGPTSTGVPVDSPFAGSEEVRGVSRAHQAAQVYQPMSPARE